jgi:hypothetical protein
MTPGNAGTLDMLNRGEIAIGPVWVDMFYTWQADGRMSPKMKLSLPSPGLPGQPMYYVIPAKAAHAALAKKFIDLAESPEVQAEGIVKQFNWYPGIDPQHVQSKMDQASWNKLFTDISPSDLSRYGRPFPLSEYFTDIVEGYERVVIKEGARSRVRTSTHLPKIISLRRPREGGDPVAFVQRTLDSLPAFAGTKGRGNDDVSGTR